MDDTPAPPPPEPSPLAEFRRWLADYAEVGDPLTALIHYRHLKALKEDLDQALSVLNKEVVAEWPRGVHETDWGGAFEVKRGAASYNYPDDPLERRQLLRDVLARVPEGEDPLPVLEAIWPMWMRHARVTPLKELGLNPNDYRDPVGHKTTLTLL